MQYATKSFGGVTWTNAPSAPISCDWSEWHLRSMNPVTRDRAYGVFVLSQCSPGTTAEPVQLFGDHLCNNDDGHHNFAQYSECLTLHAGQIPVGLQGASCGALTEVAVGLHATPTPSSLDPALATPVSVATSFDSSFTQLLQEGLCLDSLTWQDVGWTIRWPDGVTDQAPGSGQSGASAGHVLPPTGSPAPINVDVIAHLHVQGSWPTFDGGGNIVDQPADLYVDISNNPALMGGGALTPTYIAPQLSAGGLAAVQADDGSLPPPTDSAAQHFVTIRGRLFALYPRAMVLAPGRELVGSTPLGNATTATTAWTYRGGFTDAPVDSQTPPGSTGPPAVPILVQWNHAEPLSPSGQPIDEQIPITVTATTTYPDGHTDTSTIAGTVSVTIYYTALSRP